MTARGWPSWSLALALSGGQSAGVLWLSDARCLDSASEDLQLGTWSCLHPLPALPSRLQKPQPHCQRQSRQPCFPSPPKPKGRRPNGNYTVLLFVHKLKNLWLFVKTRDKYVVCWELKIRSKACYWQRLPWVTLKWGWIMGCSWRQPLSPLLLLETAKENQLFVAQQQEEMIKQINFEFTQCQGLLLYGLDTRGCLWRDFPCLRWDPEPLGWPSCLGRLASGLVSYHPSPYSLPSLKPDSVYKGICVVICLQPRLIIRL